MPAGYGLPVIPSFTTGPVRLPLLLEKFLVLDNDVPSGYHASLRCVIGNMLIFKEVDMTKADLVARIASDSGISQKAADKVIEALVSAIYDALKGTERSIRIPDLGTFRVSERKARTGVNPRTREKMEIPATVVPAFTAAKALKDIVKE